MTIEHNRRRFITDHPHEYGTIAALIELQPDENSTPMLVAQVRITDCSRPVTLDFHCNKRTDVRGRVAKVNAMIDELTRFRNALINSADKLN